MAASPKEWLHWEHEVEECAAHFQEKCAEEKDTGTCHHDTHFSQVRHECLIMHLSGNLHALLTGEIAKHPIIQEVLDPPDLTTHFLQASQSRISVRGPPALLG